MMESVKSGILSDYSCSINGDVFELVYLHDVPPIILKFIRHRVQLLMNKEMIQTTPSGVNIIRNTVDNAIHDLYRERLVHADKFVSYVDEDKIEEKIKREMMSNG
jgi:hypothetical protein